MRMPPTSNASSNSNTNKTAGGRMSLIEARRSSLMRAMSNPALTLTEDDDHKRQPDEVKNMAATTTSSAAPESSRRKFVTNTSNHKTRREVGFGGLRRGQSCSNVFLAQQQHENRNKSDQKQQQQRPSWAAKANRIRQGHEQYSKPAATAATTTTRFPTTVAAGRRSFVVGNTPSTTSTSNYNRPQPQQRRSMFARGQSASNLLGYLTAANNNSGAVPSSASGRNNVGRASFQQVRPSLLKKSQSASNIWLAAAAAAATDHDDDEDDVTENSTTEAVDEDPAIVVLAEKEEATKKNSKCEKQEEEDTTETLDTMGCSVSSFSDSPDLDGSSTAAADLCCVLLPSTKEGGGEDNTMPRKSWWETDDSERLDQLVNANLKQNELQDQKKKTNDSDDQQKQVEQKACRTIQRFFLLQVMPVLKAHRLKMDKVTKKLSNAKQLHQDELLEIKQRTRVAKQRFLLEMQNQPEEVMKDDEDMDDMKRKELALKEEQELLLQMRTQLQRDIEREKKEGKRLDMDLTIQRVANRKIERDAMVLESKCKELNAKCRHVKTQQAPWKDLIDRLQTSIEEHQSALEKVQADSGKEKVECKKRIQCLARIQDLTKDRITSGHVEGGQPAFLVALLDKELKCRVAVQAMVGTNWLKEEEEGGGSKTTTTEKSGTTASSSSSEGSSSRPRLSSSQFDLNGTKDWQSIKNNIKRRRSRRNLFKRTGSAPQLLLDHDQYNSSDDSDLSSSCGDPEQEPVATTGENPEEEVVPAVRRPHRQGNRHSGKTKQKKVLSRQRSGSLPPVLQHRRSSSKKALLLDGKEERVSTTVCGSNGGSGGGRKKKNCAESSSSTKAKRRSSSTRRLKVKGDDSQTAGDHKRER